MIRVRFCKLLFTSSIEILDTFDENSVRLILDLKPRLFYSAPAASDCRYRYENSSDWQSSTRIKRPNKKSGNNLVILPSLSIILLDLQSSYGIRVLYCRDLGFIFFYLRYDFLWMVFWMTWVFVVLSGFGLEIRYSGTIASISLHPTRCYVMLCYWK